MSFLSFNFAIFIGFGLLIFHLAPARWRPGVLLGLSYAFYLTWSVAHTALLAGVTWGVYATALWIERSRGEKGKRTRMALGVGVLLLLLFAFKSVTWWARLFFARGAGAGGDLTLLLVLPLGLSYYIFKMVGYLLDVYWETLPAQRDFVLVALYGAFFPQIVSGPIQRAEGFFEQKEKMESPQPAEFAIGLRRILFGLCKKILVADSLGILVARVHANPAGFSPLELLVGAYCFSMQLYMDFSGVTDIAIGLGLLFGVRGPENFDLPFYSSNMQLFWRRWHMSLTTWLTDYLFTPLRMSLRNLGNLGLCVAIFANMVAIGLWHGFTWTYLAFGVANAIFLTVSALTLRQRNRFFKQRTRLAQIRAVVAPLLTFHLVVFTHILFRAESLPFALKYLKTLVGMTRGVPALRFSQSALGVSTAALALCACGFFAADAIQWAMGRRLWTERFLAMPPAVRSAFYGLAAAAVLLLFKGTVTFIYARF